MLKKNLLISNIDVIKLLNNNFVSPVDIAIILVGISLYRKIPAGINSDTIDRMIELGLIEKESKDTYSLSVNLYEEEKENENWLESLYKEYKESNKERVKSLKIIRNSLNKLHLEYPFTSSEVIRAVKKYINNTDPVYIMHFHKLISAGTGVSKYSKLKDIIEEIREEDKSIEKRSSTSNIIF